MPTSPLLQQILQQNQPSSQNPNGTSVPQGSFAASSPTYPASTGQAAGTTNQPTQASALQSILGGGGASNQSMLSNILGMSPEYASQYDDLLWNPNATFY